MNLKDLAVRHDYYASESNYYSQEATGNYETWNDFYEEFNDADIDMNLIYRWDITETEEKEKYSMFVVIIAQRKGIYMPIFIDSVEEKDVPQIKAFLKPHFEKLLRIWNPLTDDFLKVVKS